MAGTITELMPDVFVALASGQDVGRWWPKVAFGANSRPRGYVARDIGFDDDCRRDDQCALNLPCTDYLLCEAEGIECGVRPADDPEFRILSTCLPGVAAGDFCDTGPRCRPKCAFIGYPGASDCDDYRFAHGALEGDYPFDESHSGNNGFVLYQAVQDWAERWGSRYTEGVLGLRPQDRHFFREVLFGDPDVGFDQRVFCHRGAQALAFQVQGLNLQAGERITFEAWEPDTGDRVSVGGDEPRVVPFYEATINTFAALPPSRGCVLVTVVSERGEGDPVGTLARVTSLSDNIQMSLLLRAQQILVPEDNWFDAFLAFRDAPEDYFEGPCDEDGLCEVSALYPHINMADFASAFMRHGIDVELGDSCDMVPQQCY